ncbi:MAG: hypothetical protein ABFQ65_04510 [Nanoarchaeota archaeon]
MNNSGEKLISVYWFTILILVAGGIVAMVYVFYGAQYDVRELEGKIINNQIADCVSWKGILNPDIFKKDYQDNFLKNCHLNFNTEDENNWKDNLQYYFEIEIFGIEDLVNSKVNFNKGNLNLISSCEIENENYEKLAKCIEGKFYSTGKNNEQYLIKILSVIRKTEKNVRQ